MTNSNIIRIDKIKWWISLVNNVRVPVPLCPDHDLRMTAVPPHKLYAGRYTTGNINNATTLKCAEGPHFFDLPRRFLEEKQYVIDRIDAKVFKGMKVIDLDGELTPIAKEKLKSKDGKYFVTSQLMESKRGIQLVVYAGEIGKKQKSQLFIEPEIRRLAFDQKNLHPTDIFVELKATFDDGSIHSMAKAVKESKGK